MYVYIYFINIYKKYIQNILYLTAMSGYNVIFNVGFNDDSDDEEEASSVPKIGGGNDSDDEEEEEEASSVPKIGDGNDSDDEEEEEASYVAANKEIASGIDRVTCMYIFCLT